MAIFGCVGCGHKFEHLVAAAWRRKLLRRRDHCPRCDQLQLYRFVTHSGTVGTATPVNDTPPSLAALWWRKQQHGKAVQAPLDAVFGRGR